MSNPRRFRPARVFFYFWCPENDHCLSGKCPPLVLLVFRQKWDNYAMDEMIQTLARIGMPAAEIGRMLAHYREDTDGLQTYVLYLRAILDDGNEYV